MPKSFYSRAGQVQNASNISKDEIDGSADDGDKKKEKNCPPNVKQACIDEQWTRLKSKGGVEKISIKGFHLFLVAVLTLLPELGANILPRLIGS